jgi:GntR family transcriptional regulator / MocR family aminotransferase
VLGKHIRIDSQPGGMHLILRLQDQMSDRHLAMRMREDGLYAEALTDWTIGGDDDGVSALFVSFTNVASQGAAENLGRRILRLI